jgi:hypothetical protein
MSPTIIGAVTLAGATRARLDQAQPPQAKAQDDRRCYDAENANSVVPKYAIGMAF